MRTPRPELLALLALLVALLVVAACSDLEDGGGEGGTGTPDVELGSGVLPATVPADFPVPATAVIGATLVDRTNGRTEVVIRIPAGVAEVVEYYEENLPLRGYTVDRSDSAPGGGWDLDFSKDDLAGSIVLSVAAAEITQAAVEFGG